jgi:hypothetical protein
MRILLALHALLILSAPALAQEHGEQRRYFGDWLAACRADGYCSATTYQNPNPGDGRVADYVLRVGRHAEEIYWELSFTTVLTMGDTAAPFIVSVDGTDEHFAGAEEIAAYGAVNDFFLLGAKAQAVMDRLAPGRELSVMFTDQTGAAQRAQFSLAGMTAALIWIDETQGRLGSERVAEAPPTGLERVGVEGGLKLGDLAFTDLPAALVEMHFGPDACDPIDMLRSNPAAYDLGEDRLLYFVPCTEGAYNYLNSVYLADRWGYTLLHFAEYESGGWISVDGVWNPRFDPATKTLEVYMLGRGIGDCGATSTHVWEGNRFVLVKATNKPECDGEGEPGEFPVVFERTYSGQ